MEERKKLSKIESIKCGFNGIKYCVQKDKTCKGKCIISAVVIIISLLLNISQIKLFIVLLLCGINISLEMINDAIEKTIDLIHPEYNEKAGLIKDIASGAVQVMCIIAIIIGLAIFIPELYKTNWL
ncbi:MAG: diacylglycerol kinase [bacterium]|nr:diacylglycerol kinase [bacterium]